MGQPQRFRQLIELTPVNWRGYNGLGAVYHSQNRYDEEARVSRNTVNSRAVAFIEVAYQVLVNHRWVRPYPVPAESAEAGLSCSI